MELNQGADVFVTSTLHPNMVSPAAIVTNITIVPEATVDLSEKYISDSAMHYFYTINCAIVGTAIGLFGIVANIINIIIFIRMGFKETINIALMGLAIADLISLTFLVWNNLCLNPLVMYSDIPIYTFEIQQKTGSYPHVIFVRVTAFITVYITFERCLCIMFPLKIKQMLTPKRVFAIIVGIYVVIIGSMSPNLATVRLVWKFIPRRNKSMYGFVFTEYREKMQLFAYYANVSLLMLSFIGVVVCSAILIWKLNKRGKWLSEATSSQEKSKVSRDSQVIKMVTIVAIIFIISFTPSVIGFWAMAVQPEFNLGKKYENTFFLIVNVFLLFDSINSSVNIFVYYKMSSKYAQSFRTLFFRKAEVKK